MNYETLSSLMMNMPPEYSLRNQREQFMAAHPDDWLCPLLRATAAPTSRKNWKVIEELIHALTPEQWQRPRLAAVLARMLMGWSSFRALPKKHLKEVKANTPALIRFRSINRWVPTPTQWRAILSATNFVDLDEVAFGRGMGKSDLLLLRNAEHLHDLKSLYINCGMTAAQARRLWGKPHLQSLQHIRIPDQPIGDEGVQALSMAIGYGHPSKRMDRLETLNLTGCGIGSVGAASLLEIMSFKHLTSLDLSNNPTIGNDAIGKLTESAPFYKSLYTLELGHTGLGDDGAKALAVSNFPRLGALGLRDNDIGDDGAIALTTASWFPRLRRLNLDGNRIGARGRAALEEALAEDATLTLRNNTPQEAIPTAAALQTLQAGVGPMLLNQLGSSSDAPFTLIHQPEPMEDLCSASFYDTFNLDPQDSNHVISRTMHLCQFWDKVITWHENWGHGIAEARAVGTVFQRLRQPMAVVLGKDSLTNDPNHPVYLLGLTAEGHLVGLRSTVCWA